jgi:platelet-activating factor acetylhydrolase IB subunit beta/gamma
VSPILFSSQTGELEGLHLLGRIAFAALLVLLGCSAACADECSGFAVQVATDAVPYQYPRGLQRTAALLSKIPARADMILLGDSLVAFWPQEMAVNQFKTDNIWNIGVGGAEVQNVLWQLKQLAVPTLRPSRVFVLIGTNNLTHDYMPACAIAAGIKSVVTSVHQKWPEARIDVMGIPPRGMDFRFRDKDRLAINAEVEAWSRDLAHLHYFEVDADEMTCGQYDRPIEVADASATPVAGSRCANYADDFGHFKRGGYDVVFKTMMKD